MLKYGLFDSLDLLVTPFWGRPTGRLVSYGFPKLVKLTSQPFLEGSQIRDPKVIMGVLIMITDRGTNAQLYLKERFIFDSSWFVASDRNDMSRSSSVARIHS